MDYDNDYHYLQQNKKMRLNTSAKISSKVGSKRFSFKGFKIYTAAAVIAIASSITACTVTTPTVTNTTTAAATPAKTESLPLVVATNSVACALAKQIAGDTIDLKCLIEAGTDPHLYQPKPDDRKAIDSAKLVLYGGYDFEPSLIKLIQASSNTAPKIAVNEVAVPSPLMSEEAHDHAHDKAERSDKKAAKEADPHVWNNAQNGIKITQSISKSLSLLRPDQVETYAKNTAKIVSELEQIDIWIKVQIATIPESSRKLVTTHDALGYYAQAYGIPVEGALNGISTDEQPTPTRVKELVEVIKTSKVPTIFAEVSINPKLITTVAKEANVKVSERELYADGLGAKGSEAETYAGMLIVNTRTIVEGLGGKYTAFQLMLIEQN
ncbi:zinc ABC transporter, periplasmic-binding protein ZnuA [Pseudanabaena sp. lw0831]|uniref:metal ABC transporter solute-binding protein, Zn/Mn family n=1 Tax=Pseudanabaena sp. lw0831 TaxID=1357935 RepID=UPI001A2F1F2E|nr:zinc ABC transporter substrate-binding protein [Pseudanabaena sp. lw0831]GBO54946.1 zinc ABC transporter, periplasmic-binding protein ZnuA [Pseudanabaena sp. lw0831]